jgi:hypothetical protein
VVNYYSLGFKIQSQYCKDLAQPELISHLQAIQAFLTHAEYLLLLQQQNTVEPRFTNASHHEQIGSKTKFCKQKTSQVTNGVSSNEHASQRQQLATSWEYRRESISCCVTFAQYTSLLEFAVPSLEFHCVLWFYYILLNNIK